MSIRLVFLLVLLYNSLAVLAAVIIYRSTDSNPFEEGGFITILSTLQLLVVAWLSYQVLQVRKTMRKRLLWRESSLVWGIISLGFFFLAADEFFTIHENIDRQIHYLFNLQETGLTDRIDDILVGLYGLTGIGVLIVYRNELKNYREVFPLFTCGFILLFAMVVSDVLTNRNDILLQLIEHDQAAVLNRWLSLAEELSKVFAEAFFILAFCAILQKAQILST